MAGRTARPLPPLRHHQHSLHDRRPPPSPALPFHLLEVSLISAQDLFAARPSMRTYAAVFIQPEHKLRTRVDSAGYTDPTWNDKFVFRVAPGFLRSDTAALTVEIFAARRAPFADILIGTARLVLSAIQPTPATRFVALQVRRPTSLRPQGILNLGVALLDSYARSAPLLYADLPPSAAAAGYGVGAREAAAPDRSESQAFMEMKLMRWRAELPVTREHERTKKERREHHKPDSRNKAQREQRPGGGRREEELCRSEAGMSRPTKKGAFGRLSCFGVGGGKWVEESGYGSP